MNQIFLLLQHHLTGLLTNERRPFQVGLKKKKNVLVHWRQRLSCHVIKLPPSLCVTVQYGGTACSYQDSRQKHRNSSWTGVRSRPKIHKPLVYWRGCIWHGCVSIVHFYFACFVDRCFTFRIGRRAREPTATLLLDSEDSLPHSSSAEFRRLG